MLRTWNAGGAVLVIAFAVASPLRAHAQDAAAAQAIRAELDRLRQEFEAVRQQYGNRLTALEAKLTALEGGQAQRSPQPGAVQAPPPTAEVPAGAAGASGPTGSLPVYGNVSAMSKIFNPDMAMIGNFIGTGGRTPVEGAPAFDMRESELSLQAIVDPYARADFFVAFGSEGVDLEEGFVTFNTLPGDLLLKAGKVKASFGKVNTLHSHLRPWADVPLVMTNLLGGDEGLADAGLSVSRLITNPWLFLEATGEVYRGQGGPFASHARGDLSYVGRLRGYRDVTEATNLDLGVSVGHGHNDAGPSFTTTLFGVDATFRYRPLRRAIYRRFIGRTELMWSRRRDDAGAGSAFGSYVSGEYQFARRWFAGARGDYAQRALDPSVNDKGASVVLTFWPSEFSQIRGQFRRTRYGDAGTANEVLVQFLFSIGAHGAHVF